jgi:hypothetical protein
MSKTISKTNIVGVVMAWALLISIPFESTAHAGSADWQSQLRPLSSVAPTNVSSLGDIAGVVQTYIFGIVLTVTFITMILSGIKFGLAKGDAKALIEAKRSLLYSMIGFVLATAAFFLRRLFLTTIGAPDMGPTRSIR